MKKTKGINYLLWLFILLWVGIVSVYWALGPQIANHNDASLHASVFQLMKGYTSIGIDLLIILLGYWYKKIKDPEKEFITGWLIVWILGILTSLIVACSTTSVWYTSYAATIYNAIFPIIRNSYPLIFGSLFGMFLVKLIQPLNNDWHHNITKVIWAMLILSFFNGTNIWGWTNPYLVVFYAFITVLGCELNNSNISKKATCIKGSTAWIIYSLLLIALPLFMAGHNFINCFSAVTNIFPIFIAFCIGRLIIGHLEHPNFNLIIIFLTLIENSSLLLVLNNFVANKLNHSSMLSGFLAIFYVIAALLLSGGITKLLTTSRLVAFDNQISIFTKHSFDQQKAELTRLFKKCLPNIGLLLSSYLITVLSMLLMYWNNFKTFNLADFVNYQTKVLFASLFPFLLIKLFQVITKRYWVSLISVLSINAVIIVANIEKIKSRSEPILPSDLKLAGVAKDIFGMVAPSVWISAGIALLALILITVFLEKKFPINYQAKFSTKLTISIVTILLFSSSVVWNHTNTPIANFLFTIGDDKQFYDQLNGARLNGPIVQFMNNLDITVMTKPNGYSKSEMLRIQKQYQKQASLINEHRHNQFKDQNVIFILSESLANPQRVPGLKLTANPLPYISKLEKLNTGGLMISPGYGGGTANMEFMALTGLSMSNFAPTLVMPYTQLVTNYSKFPSMANNFNYAVAIHPFNGNFYNRVTVYKKFGFNHFFRLDSKKYPIRHQKKLENSPAISDETTYKNIIDELNRHKGSQFINVATMQNHMPYDQHYYKTNPKYKAAKLPSGVESDSVNDYTAAIHYTDKETKEFITELDRVNKPVTVVLYGDHLPGIYGDPTSKNSLQLHETDYFIYSNKYARQHGAHNLNKNSSSYVSPNDFIAMAAKQTNSKVNWYQALLTDIYEQVPIINSAQNHGFNPNTDNSSSRQIVSRQGKLMKYSQLTKKQKRIYHDYQLVQYDITAGHHYLINSMK